MLFFQILFMGPLGDVRATMSKLERELHTVGTSRRPEQQSLNALPNALLPFHLKARPMFETQETARRLSHSTMSEANSEQ
jgi:hypothetical protein